MFIMGIDLGNDFSQVCYYNFNTSEPESVDFAGTQTQYKVPTAVLKDSKREDGWFAGDVAISSNLLGEGVLFDKILDKAAAGEVVTVDDITVMPVELMQVYLTFLIQSAKRAFGGEEEPDKICITIEDFNISVLKVIDKAFGLIGIPEDKVMFTSHVEAFVFYAISQEPALWKNDNVLFEYGKDGLKLCRMASVIDRGKRIVVTQKKDYMDSVPYTKDMEKLEPLLLKTATEEMDKRPASTVYLVGEGFEDGFSCDGFLNFLCNRRRVFAGQNLYVKGACYQAYEECVGDRFKDIIVGCNERITTGIEMKISDRGVDKILRMIKPGVNWYKAGCSFDFIIDDCDAIDMFLSPVDGKEKRHIIIPLTDFPKRENKASRITVEITCTSDSRCHLRVIDKGFGEFIKSSGKIINEDITL